MSIKSIIKQILPYFIVHKYIEKNSLVKQFRKAGYDENCDFPDEESLFKYIVSVQGFGYSGSGALVDFLREYPKFRVLGYVDTDEDGGGWTPKSMQLSEIDFIRLSGGLFEIERFIDSNNVYHNDALLNRTLKVFGSSSLYKYNSYIRDLMYRFFAKVAYLRLENMSQPYYNAYTIGLNETPDIYFLKKMPREEYVNLCRRFLTSVFNLFFQEGKLYLAADQLLSDMEFNVKRNREYIPNLKMILVIRDPRDTYAWAIKKNIEWMEHSSVSRFIEWYMQFYTKVSPEHKVSDCLIVRYEDLVLDYDTQECRINNFLELTSKDHKYRQQYFRPDFSKRFVGIYKEMSDRREEFDVIKTKLRDYCNPVID